MYLSADEDRMLDAIFAVVNEYIPKTEYDYVEKRLTEVIVNHS
jgi:hypothetical protein